MSNRPRPKNVPAEPEGTPVEPVVVPVEPAPPTEADYDLDIATLIATLGIDPATVRADSAEVRFIDGKAVLTYSVMRAIPPKALGVALLRAANGVEV